MSISSESLQLMHRAGKFTYWFSILIAALFLFAVGYLVFESHIPLEILCAYLGLSVILFLRYWRDKSAARADRRRTLEVSLHLNALIGGWPGALIAQQTLRHKSQKVSFRVMLWTTVILNCAGLAWLHSADGQALLGQLLWLTN